MRLTLEGPRAPGLFPKLGRTTNVFLSFISKATMTVHQTLIELGLIQPLKPGTRPASKTAYLEKRREAQRLRRKIKKEAQAQGVEPKLKPIGRPPIYNSPDEVILARRASDKASKARQAERLSEAIKAAFNKEANEAGPGKAQEASTQTD